MGKPQLVHVDLPEARLREMLCSAERDFRVSTNESGLVTAWCKACQHSIDTVRDDVLLWFRCPSCRLVSFTPLPNVERDRRFAIADGRPFEYEVFFLRDLPSEFPSPFERDTDTEGCGPLVRPERLEKDDTR